MRSTHVGPSWRKRKPEPPSLLLICSACQTKSDDRVSVSSRAVFDFFQQGGFQVVRIRNHLAGGNLPVRSSLIAEFTNSQAIFGANRGSENATGHGA